MTEQYPKRLFHKVPSWVEDGSVFHIRIRCAVENTAVLTSEHVAGLLLESISVYQEKHRWFAHLFLLMPDHIHALLSFPKHEVMSKVVGDWKRFRHKQLGIRWQDNFFDHRIRDANEYLEKATYIRRNPVAKGLCSQPEDWRWVFDHSSS